MAVIRDVMPAFELLQPTSIAEAQRLLEQNGSDALGAGRRPRQLRLAQGSHQATEDRGRSERDRGTQGSSHHQRRRRDRRDDHASRKSCSIQSSKRSTRSWRRPQRWWHRRRSAIRAPSAATCRRMRDAGTTVPDGPATALAETSVMPTRRRPQSRACDSARGSMRRGESFRHRPGADRARRQDS